jgi:hypothetical protein
MDNQNWDRNALERVEVWLRKFINDNPIDSIFNIGKISRKSREAAHIRPDGNISDFRHLLGKLEGEGGILITGKNEFKILKKLCSPK